MAALPAPAHAAVRCGAATLPARNVPKTHREAIMAGKKCKPRKGGKGYGK